MEEKKYKVMWGGCDILARDMRLDDALIFIKALCDKYHDDTINITLQSNNVLEIGKE